MTDCKAGGEGEKERFIHTQISCQNSWQPGAGGKRGQAGA